MKLEPPEAKVHTAEVKAAFKQCFANSPETPESTAIREAYLEEIKKAFSTYVSNLIDQVPNPTGKFDNAIGYCRRAYREASEIVRI